MMGDGCAGCGGVLRVDGWMGFVVCVCVCVCQMGHEMCSKFERDGAGSRNFSKRVLVWAGGDLRR